MRLPPKKPLLVLITLGALFRLPDLYGPFKDYKVLDWQNIPSVWDFTPRRPSADPISDEDLRLHPERDEASYQIYRISEPDGALGHFYESLRRTEGKQPGAVTRILHYGDSPTTADMITGDTRRLLQKQFGDAGHGFCLVAKPWEWYDHYGVAMEASAWTIEAATQTRVRDGFYGLGGASFRGVPGDYSRWVFRERRVRSMEISFLAQRGGGSVSVYFDGVKSGVLDTDSAASTSNYRTFTGPAARRYEIRAQGLVRLFGVEFTHPETGVIYDSLGLNGAYVTVLARMFDERHWAEQLRHREPDLVIINYGTNESSYLTFIEKDYAKELKEIIRRVRAALPESSILLMSPMDRGRREPGGEIGTMPGIPRLVALQQQVALETGCAFFNTYLAMGGPGTMGRWYQAEPRLVGGDFIHPMPKGAYIVGNLLYQALTDGYNRYKVLKMQERFAKSDAVQPLKGTVRQ
jgi:lysophospholipase L1-like esterase